jgi:uncharacterized DUF497 family protein
MSLNGTYLRVGPREVRKQSTQTRVSFEEAKTVFGDPYELMMPDPDHSGDEERSLSVGESDQRRLVFVVYRQIEEVVRIISAREAEGDEIAEYLERRGG